MKVGTLSSFVAPSYAIVMLLALGFSFVVNAQAPGEDDSPRELNGQIEQLCQQGKYKEP